LPRDAVSRACRFFKPSVSSAALTVTEPPPAQSGEDVHSIPLGNINTHREISCFLEELWSDGGISFQMCPKDVHFFVWEKSLMMRFSVLLSLMLKFCTRGQK
ncbi:hypothetical protein AMELA_G00058680, partial [Ameiurus melas]